MQRLGENAQAAAEKSDYKLENGDDYRDEYAVARHALLLGAHAVVVERQPRMGDPVRTGGHATSFPSKRPRRRRCTECRRPRGSPRPSSARASPAAAESAPR